MTLAAHESSDELVDALLPYRRKLVSDIFSRRISPLPCSTWNKMYKMENFYPRYYLNFERTHFHFSIYPASEVAELNKRSSKFNDPFPELFQVNTKNNQEYNPFLEINQTESVKKVLATSSIDEIAKAFQPRVLMGSDEGKTIFRKANFNPFFAMLPDSSIVVRNIYFASDQPKRRFEYRIYLSFIYTFGNVLTPLNALRVFEANVVNFIYQNNLVESDADYT